MKKVIGSTDALNTAIIEAMAKGEMLGFTKPYDVALFVQNTLNQKGFKIVKLTARDIKSV